MNGDWVYVQPPQLQGTVTNLEPGTQLTVPFSSHCTCHKGCLAASSV